MLKVFRVLVLGAAVLLCPLAVAVASGDDAATWKPAHNVDVSGFQSRYQPGACSVSALKCRNIKAINALNGAADWQGDLRSLRKNRL